MSVILTAGFSAPAQLLTTLEPALGAPTSGGDRVSAPGVQTQRGVGPRLRTSAWPGGWKNVARESPLWVLSFKNVQGAARRQREKRPPRDRL